MFTCVMRRECGSGLLEVLLALFLFSVAALGFGKLQLTARSTLNDADRYAVATAFAHDILERVQLNSAEIARYTTASTWLADAQVSVNCRQLSCSSAELARYDVHEWRKQVQWLTDAADVSRLTPADGELPAGGVCIEVSGSLLSVSLVWKANTVLADSTERNCGARAGLYGLDNTQRQSVVIAAHLRGHQP